MSHVAILLLLKSIDQLLLLVFSGSVTAVFNEVLGDRVKAEQGRGWGFLSELHIYVVSVNFVCLSYVRNTIIYKCYSNLQIPLIVDCSFMNNFP